MLRLQNNIEGIQFQKLLDICFDLSSYVTFTKNNWIDVDFDNHNYFLNEIKPFHLKTIKTNHWYCMDILPNNLFEVYLYRADEKVKTVIQKNHDNLFFREKNLGKPLRGISDKDTEEIIQKYFNDFINMEDIRENDRWGNIKDLPEDMCFFVDNKLFLGTVSHENICEVYPPAEEIKKQLLKIGEWEELNDDKEQQIILCI